MGDEDEEAVHGAHGEEQEGLHQHRQPQEHGHRQEAEHAGQGQVLRQGAPQVAHGPAPQGPVHQRRGARRVAVQPRTEPGGGGAGELGEVPALGVGDFAGKLEGGISKNSA